MSNFKPLINPYLWAIGPGVAKILPGDLIRDRYQVIAPQIWRDLHPETPPEVPQAVPSELLPYLSLYPHRLRVPEVYGVCHLETAQASSVTLLSNVPLDSGGELYPGIELLWSQATAVRQVYWLWQILELWTPLAELGVASSLLVPENLRVEGWRVRLRELYADGDQNRENRLTTSTVGSRTATLGLQAVEVGVSTTLTSPPEAATLQQLGACWASWCRKASVSVASQVAALAQALQAESPSLKAIAADLNQLLLEQASRQPLRLQVLGTTDQGPRHDHNEDSCYPTLRDLPSDPTEPRDPLIPHLSIVCDGIGGHEGGEVASQLAVQSVKLQVRALLAELQEDPELMTPDLVAQQLCAIIRVVNNLIAARNDAQARESRQRMGTTLTLALQLPQVIKTAEGSGNAHELYIASVGDSRAYWLTPRYCQPLTVDDDVATREVRLGRSLYSAALQRPDAGALTQAVGTRDSELLRPTVQRFILEEDGLLLLCSDGLSDNGWIEQVYAEYPRDIFSGKRSLEAAVQSLIDLASQKNGHDNISVVLTYCAVSPQYPAVLNFGELSTAGDYALNLGPDALMGASESEADSLDPREAVPAHSRWSRGMAIAVAVLVTLLSAGAAILTTLWLLNPENFRQQRDRLLQPELPGPSEPAPTPTSEN